MSKLHPAIYYYEWLSGFDYHDSVDETCGSDLYLIPEELLEQLKQAEKQYTSVLRTILDTCTKLKHVEDGEDTH